MALIALGCSAQTGGNASVDSGGTPGFDASIDLCADCVCAVDTVYRWGPRAGLDAPVITSTLTPPGAYSRTADDGVQAVPDRCSPPLPACGDSSRIDVSDIMRDLQDADVVAALAATDKPSFGGGIRSTYDGPTFLFERADGHGFYFNGSDLRGVPVGIIRLALSLGDLDNDLMQDPSCAKLPRY